MVVFEIIWAVLTVIFFLAVAIGALVGFARGAYRSAVKLGANLLSAVLALVILLAAKPALASFVQSDLLAEALASIQIENIPTDALEILFGTVSAIAALLVYGTVFFVVRLILLIPQHIISKRLPKKLTPKQKKVAPVYAEVKPAYAPAASFAPSPEAVESVGYSESSETEIGEGYSESSETEIGEGYSESQGSVEMPGYSESAAPEPTADVIREPFNAPEAKPEKVPAWKKILWHSAAILAGALSSVILVGAYVMPLAGIAVRFADLYQRIDEIIPADESSEIKAEDLEMSVKGIEKVASSPLFTVTEFVYGKTAFEPLLTVKTTFGDINLAKEIQGLGNTVFDLAEPIKHINSENNLHESDGDIIISVADKLAENKLITTVGSIAVRYAGDSLVKAPEEDATEAEKALNESLKSIVTEMEPDALSADIKAVARIADAVTGSELLEFLLAKDEDEPADSEDNKTPEEIKQEKNEKNEKLFEIIRGEAFPSLLGEIFGISYDNAHLKSMLVPIVNLGSEMVFSAMEVDVPVSEITLDNVSREQLVGEATILCGAIREISDFVDSASTENASLTTYRFDSVGRALDLLKNSVFFGNNYEAIIESVTSLAKSDSGNSTEDQFLEAVKDAILKTDSAEKLLGSAQSVVIIQNQLQNSDKKGSENEELVSALDTLSKNDSENTKETLKDLVADILDIQAPEAEENKEVNEILNDAVNVTTEIMGAENFDSAKEADALQAIYDITHSGSDNILDAVKDEEELAETIADSQIAMGLFEKLNKEGKDYGINEKLTPENRTAISEAVEKLEIDASKKQTIKDFFKIK